MVDDTNWWGPATNNQIIDVCGILKSYQRTSNYRCRGIYSMSLIIELEDRRKKFLIRCILQLCPNVQEIRKRC
ncbi:hypothetical protein K1719_035076 [Acacia pycnantha]|nr:hypothetical protein K1719_035076 [Acacia pycnantha]